MKPGLYEQIINKQMNEELASVPEECRYQEKVDSAEASRVLATYAAELMKRKMDAIYEASSDYFYQINSGTNRHRFFFMIS